MQGTVSGFDDPPGREMRQGDGSFMATAVCAASADSRSSRRDDSDPLDLGQGVPVPASLVFVIGSQFDATVRDYSVSRNGWYP